MSFRVSIAQQPLVWQDPAANRAHFARVLAPLAGATDLVVLPEMFTTGFTMKPQDQAEPGDGPTRAWLQEQAVALDAAVGGSVAVEENGRFYNRFMIATPGGLTYWYDKRHLFRMANEHERYADGKEKLIVELKGWRVCPMVCYDLRFPVWIRNRYGASAPGRFDYDLFVIVANWPAPRRTAWRTLLRARAIENLCYAVGVNRVGRDGNGHDYAGDSAAIDFLGEALVDLGAQPQVVTTTLSGAALAGHRERFPAQLDADAFQL